MNIIVSKEKFLNSYKIKGYGNRAIKQIDWLPINASKELAELAGYILSDGSIEHSYDGRYGPRGIDFITPDKVIQQRIIYILHKNFKAKPKSHYFRDTPGLRIRNANLARVLWLCGVPMGDKAIQKYDIPIWIKNGTKDIKSAFLRAYLDGDGSTPYKIYKSKASFGIRLTLNKTEDKIKSGIEFLNSFQGILREFHIESLGPYQRKICFRKNGVKTIMLEIIICRQNSILNFSKYISFTKPEKKKVLDECVCTIVANYRPRK